MTSRVAIVGTRGIPNQYGGFEQFAEYVSVGLVNLGYNVTVYNPDFHPFKESEFNGVRIVRKWCPESKLGPAAHIIYDHLCLKDAIKNKADIVLELGYQSAAISLLLCPIRKTRIITNMDGMEWKRQKWSPAIKRFTRWAEKVSAIRSHALVSDNPGIQAYLKEAYGKESTMIPYGAEVFTQPDVLTLDKYDLKAGEYNILIARLEPENNIETILDGYIQSGITEPFIVVGNYSSKYGRRLLDKYQGASVRFIGGIYDINVLNNLRYFAATYFHGHSVGGTNPSLLEAMASCAFIVAHDNIFNKSVLGTDALYFATPNDVASILQDKEALDRSRDLFSKSNISKIEKIYRWDLIVRQYADLIEKVLNESSDNYAR